MRFAHIEVDAAVALAGLEHFGREHLLLGARLLDGIAGAQRIRQTVEIQIDAVGS